MRRAITLASPSSAQNSPASVMSMPTRTVVSAATSPFSSPKPPSMYWMKVWVNWSMTPRSLMAAAPAIGCRYCGE